MTDPKELGIIDTVEEHAKRVFLRAENVGAIVVNVRRAISVSIAVLASATFAATAHAIPALQLYSPDAVYDNTTESWLVTSNSFELWVVADTGDKGSIFDVDLAASCYGSSGSVVLTPNKVIDPTPGDAGGYDNIIHHAEYADADSHIFWHLGDFTSTSDPILNYVDGSGATTGQIMKMMVSISGFDAVHFDAFDHYYTGPGNGSSTNYQTHYVFAPFSHDLTGGGGSGGTGGSGGSGGSGGAGGAAPEPGSLWMLGIGLAGMFAAKKTKRAA